MACPMKCARGQECWDSHQRANGNLRWSMIAVIGYITRVTSVAAAVTAGTPWKISEHVFPRLVCQCETVILLKRLSLGNGSCWSSHPKKAAILLAKHTHTQTHTLKHTFTPTCIDTKYLLSQHTLKCAKTINTCTLLALVRAVGVWDQSDSDGNLEVMFETWSGSASQGGIV